MNTIKPVLNT